MDGIKPLKVKRAVSLPVSNLRMQGPNEFFGFKENLMLVYVLDLSSVFFQKAQFQFRQNINHLDVHAYGLNFLLTFQKSLCHLLLVQNQLQPVAELKAAVREARFIPGSTLVVSFVNNRIQVRDLKLKLMQTLQLADPIESIDFSAYDFNLTVKQACTFTSLYSCLANKLSLRAAGLFYKIITLGCRCVVLDHTRKSLIMLRNSVQTFRVNKQIELESLCGINQQSFIASDSCCIFMFKSSEQGFEQTSKMNFKAGERGQFRVSITKELYFCGQRSMIFFQFATSSDAELQYNQSLQRKIIYQIQQFELVSHKPQPFFQRLPEGFDSKFRQTIELPEELLKQPVFEQKMSTRNKGMLQKLQSIQKENKQQVEKLKSLLQNQSRQLENRQAQLADKKFTFTNYNRSQFLKVQTHLRTLLQLFKARVHKILFLNRKMIQEIITTKSEFQLKLSLVKEQIKDQNELYKQERRRQLVEQLQKQLKQYDCLQYKTNQQEESVSSFKQKNNAAQEAIQSLERQIRICLQQSEYQREIVNRNAELFMSEMARMNNLNTSQITLTKEVKKSFKLLAFSKFVHNELKNQLAALLQYQNHLHKYEEQLRTDILSVIFQSKAQLEQEFLSNIQALSQKLQRFKVKNISLSRRIEIVLYQGNLLCGNTGKPGLKRRVEKVLLPLLKEKQMGKQQKAQESTLSFQDSIQFPRSLMKKYINILSRQNLSHVQSVTLQYNQLRNDTKKYIKECKEQRQKCTNLKLMENQMRLAIAKQRQRIKRAISQPALNRYK